MTPLFAALELVLEVTAILAFALAILFFFRRISAATQHRLLALTVLAVLVVTVASPWVPVQHLGIIPVEDVTARPAQPGSLSPQGSTAAVPTPGVVTAEPSGAAGTSQPPVGISALGTLWLAGSAIVLVWILVGMAYGWWLSLQTRRSEDTRLTDRFRWALEQVGLRRAVPLVESERLRIPVVFGWLRPRVILPANASRWPEDRLRAVLLHESAHIRRGDLARQFLAKLMCAVYWFNPLAWLVERKLFLAGERAADDQVIRGAFSAADYAEHLMTMSEELGFKRAPLWATAAMAEGTAFKDRILSILDPNVQRGDPALPGRIVMMLAAVAVIVPAVALSPWQAAAEPSASSAAPAQTITVPSQQPVAPEAQQGPEGDFETLVAMLRMRDADMREHAAEALGRLGDPRAVQPLASVVLNDDNASVREHAAGALGALGDPGAVSALTTASLNDRSAAVREHAVVALGRTGGARAFETLLGVMDADDVEEVRAHAAYALGLLGDPRALDPLVDALRDGSARMRSNAAQGLGELGDPRALDALRRAEDDPNAEVRRWVREAVERIDAGAEGRRTNPNDDRGGT